MQRVSIPIPLPDRLYELLRRMKNALPGRKRQALNLWGDRDVEFSYIAAHLPAGPGRALDFGCGPGYLALMAALRGWEVTAVDLEPQMWPWRHGRVRFIQGDFLELNLAKGSFDVIINCSAVEHVGLSGRYGVVQNDENGDLRAMQEMKGVLRPSGSMLLTIPCGRDAIHAPLHRVYGRQRLPQLLQGFQVHHESYWRKDAENQWAAATREQAIEFEARANLKTPSLGVYALGCFVLRRAPEEGEGS